MAALIAASVNFSAQGAARLEVETYAGVTIVGEIGSVYSIEYVTGLAEPTESDWRCLEFLRLPVFTPNPDDMQNYLGFRIVLAPGQP
jgi:hypothetical protein